jgi:cbb3-type cytochrome oxidase subunit 1
VIAIIKSKETAMNRLYWMRIAWPSFMAACLLQMLVFAFLDPLHLITVHETVQLSSRAVYSLAFFVFWTVTLISSAITAWLCLDSNET